MSDLAEVKALFDESQKTVTALRAEVDEMKKAPAADVVAEEKVKRIEAKFAADLKAANEASEALMARVAEAETKLARPGVAAEAVDAAEMKSFHDWMAGKPSDFESKAMTEDSNQDGGYLVPVTMREGIEARMRRGSPVRSVANVVSISGDAYEMLVERGDAGFEWTGETEAPSETSAPTVNRIAINAHELAAMPKVSQRLLDDATFDIGGWLEGRVADRFARAEAAAYINGDGVARPRGFLTHDTAAQADSARGSKKLETIATGASGAFAATGPADVLIKTVYALQPVYRAGAVWMAKSTTAAAIATMRDGDDKYVMQTLMDGAGGVITRVAGYELVEAEDMPAIAANSLSLAFGGFRDGYTIVDAGGVRILRDPFSAKPHVLFYTTKRTGGDVSNFDAIKLVKFSS